MLLRRWAALGGGVLSFVACGGVPTVGPAKTPEFQPANETKCAIVKSHSEPLVVEWPMSDRAKLETLKKTGLIAVQYEGCHMKLLPYCKAPGRYAYDGVTRKHDRVVIRNTSELYANLPAGAVQLEGHLAQGGELGVRMTVVGRYVADRPSVRTDELTGDCKGATHVIAAMTVGAFDFEAYGKAKARGGIQAFGAGAGGSTSSEKETLSTDGNETACALAKRSDQDPPDECGAPIRVEVLELAKPEDPAKAWITAFEQAARNVQTALSSNDAWVDELKRKLAGSSCPNDPDMATLGRFLQQAVEANRASGWALEDLRAQSTKATFGSKEARDLDARIAGLHAEALQHRTQLTLVADTVISRPPCAKPGRLAIKVDGAMGAEFVLTRARIVHEGAVVYDRAEDKGTFPRAFEAYTDAYLPAGEHTVAVEFDYRLPHAKRATKVTVKSSYTFRSEWGASTFLAIVPTEGRGARAEDKPRIRFRWDDEAGKPKETIDGESRVSISVAP